MAATLPGVVAEATVRDLARRRGVALTDAQALLASPPERDGLLIGYGLTAADALPRRWASSATCSPRRRGGVRGAFLRAWNHPARPRLYHPGELLDPSAPGPAGDPLNRVRPRVPGWAMLGR